jgi:hypothetical protein
MRDRLQRRVVCLIEHLNVILIESVCLHWVPTRVFDNPIKIEVDLGQILLAHPGVVKGGSLCKRHSLMW